MTRTRVKMTKPRVQAIPLREAAKLPAYIISLVKWWNQINRPSEHNILCFYSKRPLDRFNFTDSVVQFICKLCQTIRCIIVRNFAKLREHRHLFHECLVLFRLVLLVKKIEPFNVWRILDDS